MADEVQSQGASPKEYAKNKYRNREQARTCNRIRNARRNNTTNVPPKPVTKPARINVNSKFYSTFDALSRSHILTPNSITKCFSLFNPVRPSPIYDEQFGFAPGLGDALSALKVLAATKGLNVPRKVMKLTEGMISLYFSLREAQSRTQMMSILVVYLNGMCEDGVLLTLTDYVQTLFEFESQASDEPQWLSEVKELQTNWTRAVNGEGFTLISKLMSLCLALGMCSVSNLHFTVAGIKMFSIPAQQKHCTAVDLIDAVFETVTYFLEGGYLCFQQGSLKPLLYGGFNTTSFETGFNQCLEYNELVRAGNLEKIAGKTENDFEILLSDVIELARDMIRSAKGPVEKNILTRKLEQLVTMRANFRQTRVQGGLRVAPYTVGVYGTTGVGKSSITQLAMKILLNGNGYDSDDRRIVTLNEHDKFMSNYRSYVNGVIIDDLGNTKADFVEKAPTSRIIEIVNNVRAYANVAEADIKGKVSIEPFVTIITTNVKGYCANVYSNEPASIARRANLSLTVRVRSEYSTDQQLDPAKIQSLHPDGPPAIPDFWEIDIEKAYPIKNGTKGMPDTIGWRPVEFEGKPMTSVSLQTFLECALADSAAHFNMQKQLVEKSNNLHEVLKFCDSCRRPATMCKCSDVDPIPEQLNTENVPDDISVLSAQAGIPESVFAVVRSPKILADTLRDAEDGGPLPLGMNFWSRMLNRVCYSPRKWYEFWKPERSPRKPIAFLCDIENSVTSRLISDVDALEKETWWHWTAFIPQWGLDQKYAAYLFDSMNYSKLQKQIKFLRRKSIAKCCLSNLGLWLGLNHISHYNAPLTGAFWLLGMVGSATLVTKCLTEVSSAHQCAKAALYNEIDRRREALPSSLKQFRDNHMRYILGASVGLVAVHTLVSLWKATKLVPEPHGNLAPETMTQIAERDAEQNPWAEAMVSPIPCSVASKTTTFDDLKALVTANLYYMSYTVAGKRTFCDAFFPCSNVALVPQHIWTHNELDAKFVRHDPKKIGGNFSAKLSRSYTHFFPDTDLALVWVPSGGDHRDLSAFFTEGSAPRCPATMLFRKEDGEIETFKTLMSPSLVSTVSRTYQGHKYTLDRPTFRGLCMAVLVTETKGPTIGGFHLGGVTGKASGASGCLPRAQLDVGIANLRNKEGVLISKNSGTLPTSQYDIQFFQDNKIHPKSPINFLPEGANLKYYGQVIGRSTYYSAVVSTPISDIVEKICGVPNKWGKPKFDSGYPWQASLQYSSNPSVGVPGDVLQRAVIDYRDGIIEKLLSIEGWIGTIKPLTDMEIVCGIDGLRFIDKMPPNTSVGFPLSGPKRDHLTLLDPKDYPSHACPATLNPIFHEEADNMEKMYLRGERAYPFFKACLKDEPTPLIKDKVRVFQSAPIAFQLLIRKYYLPIMRILSVMPFVSECAVGINALGTEWSAFSEHIHKFGKDRILAGDFSKYDLRMPAQLMLASFRVYIDIARHCKYSPRDISIMEGIASDISYPLMAYNGDLLQLFGSNPSGQNLTVYLNGGVNSLLLRCFFYTVYPKGGKFRDAVAAMTYGDDLKSSVHKDFPKMNHVDYAKYLLSVDIVFTMPDKESVATEYMHDLDADFLKRKNVTMPELGVCVGALCEDSIFKSLHAVLKSNAVTTTQQSMSNIDGALREWFAHGRDVYERRREQMSTVAHTAGISHGCTQLTVTYDDQLQVFCEKYNVKRLDEVPEPETL